MAGCHNCLRERQQAFVWLPLTWNAIGDYLHGVDAADRVVGLYLYLTSWRFTQGGTASRRGAIYQHRIGLRCRIDRGLISKANVDRALAVVFVELPRYLWYSCCPTRTPEEWIF